MLSVTADDPLQTRRLILRPHRDSDLEDLLAFHSDPEVVRYTPWPVRDREATAATLRTKVDQATITEPGQWLVLAVELRSASTVIGEVLLKWESAENRQGEIGFAFARDHQGQGYATEAAAEMLRLGFEALGLHRIIAVCIEENRASTSVLGRLGFTQEARLVDNLLFKGAWATQLVFALTEDRWRSAALPSAESSDVVEVRRLVDVFFAAFASAPDIDRRVEALRAVMLPGAIIVRACGQEPQAFDIDTFIAPRYELLTNGTLTDFSEAAQSGDVEVFGDIAQWFGRYAKSGTLNGAPYAGGGMKSMQFARTGDGWRISAVAWDDDRVG